MNFFEMLTAHHRCTITFSAEDGVDRLTVNCGKGVAIEKKSQSIHREFTKRKNPSEKRNC